MKTFTDFFKSAKSSIVIKNSGVLCQSQTTASSSGSTIGATISGNSSIACSSSMIGVPQSGSWITPNYAPYPPFRPSVFPNPVATSIKKISEETEKIILDAGFNLKENTFQIYEKDNVTLTVSMIAFGSSFKILANLSFTDSNRAGIVYWQLEDGYVLNEQTIEFEFSEELFSNIMKYV